MKTPDVMVTYYGTLVGFWPITLEAKAWVEAHIPEDAPTMGRGFYAEPRYAEGIAVGMIEDGLAVVVNACEEVN